MTDPEEYERMKEREQAEEKLTPEEWAARNANRAESRKKRSRHALGDAQKKGVRSKQAFAFRPMKG